MNWLDALTRMGGQQQAPTMDNPFAAQMAYDNAQQDRQRAMQMQQAQYQGGGTSGILAGLLTMLGGKALEKRADETASSALSRQFEFQNAASQKAAEQAAAEDERKFRRELERDRKKAQESEKAKAANRAPSEFDRLISMLPPEQRARAAQIKAGLAPQAQAAQQTGELERRVAMARAQGASDDQIRALVLGTSNQQAPAGYQPTPDGKLAFIPGGPADPNRQQPVAGEQAARLAMADVFLKDAPQIQQEIKDGGLTGPWDSAQAQMGYGRQGELARQIQSGTDALLRNLTGAGMSETEAQKYAARYAPSRFDTEDSLASKVAQLTKELTAYQSKIGGGAAPAGAQSAPVDYQSVMAKYGL